MKNIRTMLQQGRILPEPPKVNEATFDIRKDKVDGRARRRTGRDAQFNTRVRTEFIEKFDAAMAEECERLGMPFSRPYFLELLLTSWNKNKGNEVTPFGLSKVSLEGALAIADQMGWELEQVLEDALVARCRDLQLTKKSRKSD